MRILLLALLASLALVGCKTNEPPLEPELVTLSIEAGHEEYVQFVAYQDGAGAWLELEPVAGEYSFEVTDEAGRYGAAVVCYYQIEYDDGYEWIYLEPVVVHATTGEFRELTVPCQQAEYETASEEAELTVAIANPIPGVTHRIRAANLGYPVSSAPYERTLAPLREGLHDVVVYIQRDDDPIELMAVYHDADTSDPGVVTVDFDDSLPPDQFTVTLRGVSAGDQLLVANDLLTRNGTRLDLTYEDLPATGAVNARTFHAAPPELLAAGDTHRLFALTQDASGHRRAVERNFAAGDDLDLTFPEGDLELTEKPVTPGAYPRYGVTWQNLDVAFTRAYFFFETDEMETGWEVIFTPAWLSEGAYTIPDLSDMEGWDPAWNASEADVVGSYLNVAVAMNPIQLTARDLFYWEVPLGGERFSMDASLSSYPDE